MVRLHGTRRTQTAVWRPFGILLLSPLILVVTVAILFGMLGIFVLWLATVGGIVSAIVISDLIRRSAARLGTPVGRLDRRPVGYPGH